MNAAAPATADPAQLAAELAQLRRSVDSLRHFLGIERLG